MEKELKPDKETVEKDNKEVSKEKEGHFFKHRLEAKDAEIEKWKSDANHWKNEYFKAYADTQNLRKNIERDLNEALKYRAEGFIGELIPVLDGFYFALAMEPSNPELKNYLIGFQYIYKNILAVLEKEGVQEIAPQEGQPFDHKTMHAVETQEREGQANTIIRVLNKGYKLKDRLIRPANVIVSKAPACAAKEDKNDEKQMEPSVKKDA